MITEIVCDYKPDGINLDYIRYPQSIAAKFSSYDLSNWGFTQYARNDFKSKYGKDPVELTQTDSLWPAWSRYRQDKVTAFVLRIRQLTRQNGVKLTAVIFPDRQKALETKQQDWRTWSALGYIDGFTPLFLTCDAKTARAMMNDVMSNKSKDTDLYAGLFVTFMDGSNEDLIRQIHEARKMNAKGIIIFDFAHLRDNYVDTLTASVFKPNEEESSLQCNTSQKIKQKHKLFRRKQKVCK